MEKIEDSGGLKDKKELEESQVPPTNVDVEAFMKRMRGKAGETAKEEPQHSLASVDMEAFAKETRDKTRKIKKEVPIIPNSQFEFAPHKPIGRKSEEWALTEVGLFTEKEKEENLRVAQETQIGELITPTSGKFSGFAVRVVEINLEKGIILVEFGNSCYWEPAKYLKER